MKHRADTVQLIPEPRESEEGLNLFYSSAVEGDMRNLLGAPHYSYRFAESKFVDAFNAESAPIYKLLMPEYYNQPESLPDKVQDRTKPSAHLIFRSTEQIRLLKFAWNICCFAWEFDVIKDETGVDEHPFLNQKRMLTLCDEIWVPCVYTKEVLNSYEISSVHVIPAPIATDKITLLPRLEALSYVGHLMVAPLHYNFLLGQSKNKSACGDCTTTLAEFLGSRLRNSSDFKVYLTVLNPEDFRKNLDAMIRAFDYFSMAKNNSVLLVKLLTSSSRFSLLDVLTDVIPRKMPGGTSLKTDNIAFFNDYLTEEQMGCLYLISDFYLCSSFCEGQNLPLLEAMAHGIVPVTTANTAMQDYITRENAVIIQGRSTSNDCVHLAGTIAGKPFSIMRSRTEDIYDGLMRSSRMSPTKYARMSEEARATVNRQYSTTVVWKLIQERLAAVRSSFAEKIARRKTQS